MHLTSETSTLTRRNITEQHKGHSFIIYYLSCVFSLWGRLCVVCPSLLPHQCPTLALVTHFDELSATTWSCPPLAEGYKSEKKERNNRNDQCFEQILSSGHMFLTAFSCCRCDLSVLDSCTTTVNSIHPWHRIYAHTHMTCTKNTVILMCKLLHVVALRWWSTSIFLILQMWLNRAPSTSVCWGCRAKKQLYVSSGALISRNVLPHISDQCTEVECHLVKLVKVSLLAMGTS